MSRIFGCACNQTQALHQALMPVKSVLAESGPIARWGLGYVQAGEVCLALHPRGAELGVDFYGALENTKSDYLIGYALKEPDGLKGNANTQPFRFRRWFYAQEGEVKGFADVQDRLLEHVPDYLQRNIKGRTSAEVIFHLFLSNLHDAGRIDDPNLDVDISRRALRNTLALVDSVRQGEDDGPGNIICTNSRTMLAVRRGQPLFLRHLKELADPKLPESQFRAVLIVGNDSNPGEGFEEVPHGKMVAVHRDLTTEILDLTPRPGSEPNPIAE